MPAFLAYTRGYSILSAYPGRLSAIRAQAYGRALESGNRLLVGKCMDHNLGKLTSFPFSSVMTGRLSSTRSLSIAAYKPTSLFSLIQVVQHFLAAFFPVALGSVYRTARIPLHSVVNT
jgi:hypothetical protein